MERRLTIPSFLKGINQSLDKQLISIDEAYEAQNVDISDGTLKRCKGTTLYNTANLGNSIESLLSFYHGGIVDILAGSNGKMYKLSGNSFIEIASGFTSNVFDSVNYQSDDTEIIIFCNGKDTPKVYDGTTVRDLKFNGKNSIPGPDNVAPKFKFIELHKERLWGAGAERNKVHFSAPFDVDDWTAPVDEVEVNQHGGEILIPTWDGGDIVGLKTLFDDVMIFKTKNVFKIFGSYPGNYTMLQVFNTVNGRILDKTIQALNNKAFWTTTEGLYLFNGVDVLPLTPRIKNEFANINQNAIDVSCSVIYKNKYILSVPEGTSTANNMIIEYDIDDNYFMIKRGINANSFVEVGGKLIYTSNDGKLYEYDTGDSFNGQSINSFFETGQSSLQRADLKKSFYKLYFTGSGNGIVRISIITDKGTKYKDITLTDTEKLYKVGLKNKGSLVGFKFENINGCNFTIKQPEFIYDA